MNNFNGQRCEVFHAKCNDIIHSLRVFYEEWRHRALPTSNTVIGMREVSSSLKLVVPILYSAMVCGLFHAKSIQLLACVRCSILPTSTHSCSPGLSDMPNKESMIRVWQRCQTPSRCCQDLYPRLHSSIHSDLD